jgi:predicted metal-dependent hydrolase
MQILQDTWNNYRAYRRLTGLWAELNSLSLLTETEAYEKKFLEFLECFNRIAYDQIA